MSSSLEAKITELHLLHYTQDEIVAALKTGKPWFSRYIRQFHQTALIPDALRIGRPSKRSNDLATFLEAGTRRRLPIPQLFTTQSEVSRELNEKGS
jgi:hypothetical protein